MGDSDTALALQDRALDIAREQSDHLAETAALSGLGALLEAQNNYEGAKQRLEQAFNLEAKMNNPVGMAENLYQLARLHYLQGDQPTGIRKIRGGETTVRGG